jgi:hypothetical protein
MGLFDALSVAAMVLGAVLAPVLIARTSLRTSFVVLGIATVVVTFASLAGLRRLGELTRKRAEVLASRLAVIEQLPILIGAPRIVLEQLASASQICPLPPGVDVVAEGAPAHAFYAVVDGTVLVHLNGEEIARIGPGGSFGERGLLDNAPRNATVTTEAQSTVIRIDGDVLLDALQSAPTVLSAIDRSNNVQRAGAPVDEQPGAVVDDPAWGTT